MFLWSCSDAVDSTIQHPARSRQPFRGEAVLLCGDFQQLLVVTVCRSRAYIIHECVKTSPLYKQFRSLHLTENVGLTAL